MKHTNITRLALFLATLALLLAGCVVSRPQARSAAKASRGIVTANGIDIAYESFGAPEVSASLPDLRERETVLLIAGTGRQLTDWPLALVERLVAKGYRVIRFDNRDVGLSTKLDGAGYPDSAAIAKALEAGTPAPLPYTLHDMANDTLGLLDALGVREAHIVGISMGSAIAELLAIDHPERTLSLTLMMADSGDPWLPDIAKPDVFAAVPPPPTVGDIDGFIEYDLRIRQALTGPGYPIDAGTLRAAVERDVARSYEPDGLTRQATVSLVSHIESAGYRRSKLRNIRVPTVVLHGTHDPLVAVESARDIAAQVPHAELRIIDGLGHDIPPALVQQFADAIIAAATRARPS